MLTKVFATVLVLLTLTACGAEPVAPALPAERLALPFDRYRPGFAEETEIGWARATLVRACLRDRGVELAVPDDDRVPGALDRSPNLRRYGVIDEASATNFGYHFPKTPEERQRQSKQRRWVAGLTEAQRTTLFGEHGCTEQAETELTAVDDGFLTDADFRSLRSSETDPRVGAAIADWRTCMAGRGYDYADSRAAISDPRWHLDAEPIPDEEKGTALADVQCKATAHLVEVWHDVEAAAQEQTIRHDAARFDGLATARQDRLAAARRVLGSS
ncbi:hypothetical protein Amsp01_064600 [Amycolatopsis sp. NBRC 101858]|uniref:hypothetical protein n=1 Tax=Amycolatopsis sp. NBRC 101858 TaxID=3032200 RepID=UPI0024A447CF|nr:hypothetical protein [Amycolatopsis sp. NBRC 101858]GLY40437.1 hypothetical protein Amsp01_064600 [Amycolatopsis sp. NBRC 101858]